MGKAVIQDLSEKMRFSCLRVLSGSTEALCDVGKSIMISLLTPSVTILPKVNQNRLM